jgi:hypothetical protein
VLSTAREDAGGLADGGTGGFAGGCTGVRRADEGETGCAFVVATSSDELVLACVAADVGAKGLGGLLVGDIIDGDVIGDVTPEDGPPGLRKGPTWCNQAEKPTQTQVQMIS